MTTTGVLDEDAHAIATHLVAFANQSGGHDNITVALARVGEVATAPPSSTADQSEGAVSKNAAADGGESHG